MRCLKNLLDVIYINNDRKFIYLRNMLVSKYKFNTIFLETIFFICGINEMNNI